MNINKLINSMADKPFKFGSNDCYSFTARLVKAWHGVDHIKRHAVYKNQKQASEYMAAHGGIEALTTGTLGYSCHPLVCGNGDVVTAEVAPGEIALGFVFEGNGLFKTKKSVLKIPLNKCRTGWRIK